MHLVHVKRFIKIQVLTLKNEGLTSKEISRYLNLTNRVSPNNRPKLIQQKNHRPINQGQMMIHPKMKH